MFGDLEKQRDELTATVAALRSFEATYRSQPDQPPPEPDRDPGVRACRAEPTSPRPFATSSPPKPRTGSGNGAAGSSDGDGRGPEQDRGDAPTLGGGSPTSNTPRLDALLGDQR